MSLNLNQPSVTTRLPFLLLLLAFGAAQLTAQDIHFSQFANSPLNINPGQNGVFGGDMRFIGNYRRQWAAVPVPYTTFSGSVENKFYFAKGKYDRFISGGLLLNYDRQGTLNLTSLSAGIPISLTLPIAKTNYLTFGVTPALGQRSFGSDKLSFDNQFVDCFYDPAADSRESQVFTNSSLTYFNISAGANLRLQAEKSRSKLDIGGGLFNINQPLHNFWGGTGDVRLRSRAAFTGHGILQLSKTVDLVGMALHQRQGAYREWVFGAGGRYHMNTKVGQELAIQGAIGFRSRYTDAIVPQVELLWKTWQVGLSYDINVSNFDLATNRRGGPELSVIYRLYRVKPLPYFKTCPII
jgi:type IX secretion system PorP/SprF family membrane protein